MGVRSGESVQRQPRRDRQDRRRFARIAMEQRYKRAMAGDDEAWDSADDAQLYEYYAWMQRVVWSREPDVDMRRACGYMRRVREEAGWSFTDLYDYLQWWSERDEWCRDNVPNWQQTNVFVALSVRNRARYEERW